MKQTRPRKAEPRRRRQGDALQDRRAPDAVQSASDADQSASNADQAAAELDQAAAASDQRAADLDQAATDKRRHVDAGGVASDAYDASRRARVASAKNRRVTRASRSETARARAETSLKRDTLAAARDAAARRRDVRAEANDRSAAASDASLSEQLSRTRTRAAAARVRAAADRDRSARDRADAAYERSRLAAKRIVLEEELRQSQKMEEIGQLAGGIAHDFNNLITAIRGNATLALTGLARGEGPREALEEIEQAADRAASLTRQLLAFARRTALRPERVNLGAIVRGLEPMLRRLIDEDVTLIIDTPTGSGWVLADPGQMEQVVVNLVVNARDAMPHGGCLTITLSDTETAEATASASGAVADGPMTSLSVADTGVGMDAETQGRIFEPFFTTKGPGEGTGLGLAMVYGIVRQSSGTIVVSSELGRGSVFTVSLPRIQAPEQGRPPSPNEPVAGTSGTATILVVEDDVSVLRFVGRVLAGAGYSVLTASDGATALEASDGVTVHLVIADVVMPGMSGSELASRLVALHPDTRVLYMSGHPVSALFRDGVLGPDATLLAKPFTAEALLSAVETVMLGSRPINGSRESS